MSRIQPASTALGVSPLFCEEEVVMKTTLKGQLHKKMYADGQGEFCSQLKQKQLNLHSSR